VGREGGPLTVALSHAIEALAAMPDFVTAAVDGATPARLRERPAAGEFSLAEHACHLRDLEREGYVVRVRRMLAERVPALVPFDGAAVARARDYLAQDARLAAREFAAARRELTGLLAPLTEEDLRREGTFDGKPVRLAELLDMMLEHDRGHRAEIEALLGRAEPR
jgi:uncharacterized damage-inducible protein DinB